MSDRHLLSLMLAFFICSPSHSHAENRAVRLGDISNLGISLTMAADFVIQQATFLEGTENTYKSIVAQKDEQVLRIDVTRNIDGRSAQRAIEDISREMRGACTDIPAPYPGMISNTIECPDELKPEVVYVEIEERSTPVYLLPSTSRFTHGASAAELIKYRGAVVCIYDDTERALYKIEWFIPKEQFSKKQALAQLGSIRYRANGKTGRSIRASAGENRNYNLLIIAIDPLGVEHIGAYGYRKDTTPNLDKYAKSAFLFQNAVSSSSWTVPSVMSWFTSLYPSQHGIRNTYSVYTDKVKILANLSALSPSVVTLAQILRKNGYSTAGFTGGAGVDGSFGYNLGFDTYFDEVPFAGFRLVMPLALEWLEEHRKEPFFLFIHGYDLHGRYRVPEDFSNKFANPQYAGNFTGTVEEYWNLREIGLRDGQVNLSPEDVNFWTSLSDSKLFEADRLLGTLLEELDKMGLREKTVVIISSPSGNEYFEHERIDHGFSLYDELIHVPLIVKIPGEDHGVVASQVRTVDIMPTALELLGIAGDQKTQNQMQGLSLVALMKGENGQRDAFSETDYLHYSSKRSLRTHDGWKYIHSTDTGQRELYNLILDPRETDNLVEQESRTAYELEQKLFGLMRSMGSDERAWRPAE